ncbi:MAG: hypothetical protein A4E43_01452 [Methanosaeta sp. PtaB.Bin005]|nr:MAG: hypothetical protein A4E43_01452 [Methanosaeta sp. PtaB.Bin005]
MDESSGEAISPAGRVHHFDLVGGHPEGPFIIQNQRASDIQGDDHRLCSIILQLLDSGIDILLPGYQHRLLAVHDYHLAVMHGMLQLLWSVVDHAHAGIRDDVDTSFFRLFYGLFHQRHILLAYQAGKDHGIDLIKDLRIEVLFTQQGIGPSAGQDGLLAVIEKDQRHPGQALL